MRFAVYDSPLGPVAAAVTPLGLWRTALGRTAEAFARELAACCEGRIVEERAALARLFSMLDRYFAGRPVVFDLPLHITGGPFDRSVWSAVARIPWGEVRTYGEVARRVSRPAAARAVGGACGRNPLPVVVPCHRVVAASGRLGGFSEGAGWKRGLLRIEGVRMG
ncbi:MAG TPA: methylated-DNA--[protein]-cysteine S-methyltransferase [Deltaproteobacteria bacterium]|nr:methylated-DNA--[protein]-cysteine S-methyltransferase [Deltaproteobacteria bacterium]